MADALSPALIPLDAVDPAMLEALLDRAFGPGRTARTAYKVREGTQYLSALSFAALDEAELLVASIQAWPVALTDDGGRAHPLLMIGPVAVLPERQGEGFGRALITAQAAALEQLAGDGDPLPQVLIGDEPYYGRFGYNAHATGGWRLPGPFDQARLLVRAVNPAILPTSGMLGPWKG